MELLSWVLLLLFFWVAVVRSSDSLLSPKGVNYEVAALMSMKSKMRNEHHVLDGWDIDSVDPCTWSTVGCSPEGFVIALEMANVGLSGTLSPSVGNLSHLHPMLLQNNQLSGPVPSEIGKLSELETLDLSGNQFTCEIPSFFGFLTHLNYSRLSRNKLSGQIPRPVANLTELQGTAFSVLHYQRKIAWVLQNLSMRHIHIGK
ncbi:LRR receptor-like serine/threonine-protein kinase [Actinidia chinensis var. chinensis]|uniref:LRR receptor-like serine/threonine-protein kinase n=1 Tax=Actinidia chinensis var. chinensis TaxID=1590841 RepID=A0A2R6RG85_ACTCC|nr:LRR receptor-like serine/threonine-protein kinase [Actinidia chinensis var. chinensis]